MVSGDPSAFSVGGCQLSVAEPVVAVDATVISNGPSSSLFVPSEATIVMLLNLPVDELDGVPASLPVAGSNVAQAGLL